MNTFLEAFWGTAVSLAPALLFGLGIAGVLHLLVRRDKVFAHLGKPGPVSSLKAALIGVPLPLCSCSVLPTALGLRRDGASRGAVTSFLISTPQTGVDSISVTWAVLGWPVALAKVVAAFVAGIIGGTLADRLHGNGGTDRHVPGCAEDESGTPLRRFWNYSIGTIFRDIYRWLAVGIAVSALITVFLAPGQLAEYPALRGPLGLLAALAVGVPLYVCSTASVPVAAGLIYAGFPVGSALVFLMAGPATNAVTMGAVRKTLGGRVFAIYISTVVLISLAAGLLLNSLDVPIRTVAHVHGGVSVIGVLATVSAGLMLGGMVWFSLIDAVAALKSRRRSVSAKTSAGMTLCIDGMTCHSCEGRVRSALEALPNAGTVTVSAGAGTAVISGFGGVLPDRIQAEAAVKDLGFSVRGC